MVMKLFIKAISLNKSAILFALLSVNIFCCILINAQERKLLYNVLRNGSIIGKISLTELINGQKKFLNFSSEVKTRFIFSFSDNSSETAAYDNGVMMYSSFYQKQNGSVKANKTTIADGQRYKLVDRNITRFENYPPIRYNMLLLYTNLPDKVDKVYSDNYQKHLDIKKIDQNRYRLSLPDGNYNYYTYENGICTRVDIERTLFTIHFQLAETSSKN
jgi:hypothetical protein